MFPDQKELERLKAMPFWERTALPRIAHLALGLIAVGGVLLYLDHNEPGWSVEFLYLLPVSLKTLGYAVGSFGTLVLLLWGVAVSKKRCRETDETGRKP